jgi:ribonuclease Z
MTTQRILRTLVSITSLAFAALAAAIWTSPESAARQVGVEAIRASGFAMLRADFGGLFAGMAVLCAAAATTQSRAAIRAATTMIAAILVGRTLGWINAGRIGSDVVEMAVEIGVAVLLVLYARGGARAASSGTAPEQPAKRAAERRGNGRPALIAGALAGVVLAGVAALLTPAMEQRMFAAGARRRTSSVNRAPLADDALRVAVCGSSAPLPSPSRAKACVAVFAGGRYYVVDAGPESVENLVLWGIPLSQIGGVFLTHFHSDHIGDLGELNLQTWAAGRAAPLDVYGGPGVAHVVDGFNDAYRLDQAYRTAHHTDRVMPPATWPMVPHTIALNGPETARKDRTAVAFDAGDLRITAIEVDHAPIAPAYAYRFDYKGRSVLVTGDLKFHPSLVTAANGVDVLVSEAIAPSMTRALGQGAAAAGRDKTAAVMHDIEDYHITPEQAAHIANDAGVSLLVFYHLLPAPDSAMARRVFTRGLDEVRRGNWTIAEDGSLYSLPLESTHVQIGRVVD